MSNAPPDSSFGEPELLADVIARLIADCGHVAVGNASPIPATAALLARALGNGRPHVSLLGSRRNTFWNDGGRELFDCAGQGQIDGEANINLVCIGDPRRPQARFPGSFGSTYLYFVVPKVILFRLEHSRRTLVRRVDFISAPGTSEPHVHRPGGPVALVTNRCLFSFDRARRRFRLESVHPGHTVEEVMDETGFDFDRPDIVPETAPPSPDRLRMMRQVVAPALAEVYPQFAARVFGV
jgi:glutaconate CoA-transferase subunit B